MSLGILCVCGKPDALSHVFTLVEELHTVIHLYHVVFLCGGFSDLVYLVMMDMTDSK